MEGIECSSSVMETATMRHFQPAGRAEEVVLQNHPFYDWRSFQAELSRGAKGSRAPDSVKQSWFPSLNSELSVIASLMAFRAVASHVTSHLIAFHLHTKTVQEFPDPSFLCAGDVIHPLLQKRRVWARD